MKNLSPSEIYWITLVGIALCFLAMGYALGMLRGGKIAYNDGRMDAAEEFVKTGAIELPTKRVLHRVDISPEPKHVHFDSLDAPPTWVTDCDCLGGHDHDCPAQSSLTTDHRPLTTGMEVQS